MLRIHGLAISLVAGAFLAAAPVAAQVESKCLSGKLKGAGSSASAQVNCEAKAAAKGVAVDPECVTRSQAKLQKAFEKAENKDDCIATGDAAAAQALVDDFVADLEGLLNPPPVICCQAAGACLYAADAAACTAIPGATPGADGSVCTGSGACAAPPASAGPCCQDFMAGAIPLDCANGTFDATACGMAGGTFSTAICSPSGQCL
jgi:hypothetical protein